MDRMIETAKSKNFHSIQMSCLKKCIKWSIAINSNNSTYKNVFYYGDYLFSTNDQIDYMTRLQDLMPIDLKQVQLYALEKCDKRLKFNIEFDLSGINTPFKNIGKENINNSYEIIIDANLHKKQLLSDKMIFVIKGRDVWNAIINRLKEVKKSGLRNKENKYFCKILGNVNCSIGIGFHVNNEYIILTIVIILILRI